MKIDISLKKKKGQDTEETLEKDEILDEVENQEPEEETQENIEDVDSEEFEDESQRNHELYQKELHSKYRILKIKKFFITSLIYGFILALLGMNIYNNFFKDRMSNAQMAQIVNAANKTTNFPTEGVEGYLKRTVNTLAKDSMKLDEGVKEAYLNTASIQVLYVSKKSDTLANVYFKSTIKSSVKENWHTFMIPLYYNPDTLSYAPAGKIQVTSSFSEPIEEIENKILSFKELPVADKSEIESANVFMKNFFTLVYNQKGDYHQLYTGTDNLGDNNATFVDITALELYAETNQAGFNGKITYRLKFAEGVTYTTTSYILLEKSGNTWVLKMII